MNNSDGGQVITWTSTSYTLVGELLIDVSSSGGVYDIYVNGSKVADTSSSRGWVNCGTFANVNEIQFAGTTYGTSNGLPGNAGVEVYGIKVGGAQLIDSDVTPPNVPSVASTCRANPSAGFSIVTWTGTASGQTVGHNLGAAPDMIIVKSRDHSQPWAVYHSALGKGGVLQLQSNSANITTYPEYWGTAEPTSTVFGTYTGSYPWANNYDDMVAYCWTHREGYSAFGSYIGNGSTNGPFVYTGHHARFLMIKCSTKGGEDWLMLDTARDTYNDEDSSALYASLSHADNSTSTVATDILSNGFRPRTTNAVVNENNQTYVYMSLASHPFKTARAR